MAGKKKDGITVINKLDIKPKKLVYIWASDGMDWIMVKPNAKAGDIVQWAYKKHKLLATKDSLTGEPRLTYKRGMSKNSD